MAQERMCRVPCVIVIRRSTGEMEMEWDDVPASAVDAWCQGMARAWETAQSMTGQAGEDPANNEGGKNDVQV